MNDDSHFAYGKLTLAWLGVGLAKVGIHSWSDAAAVAATFYSLLMIGDWCWKKWKRR